MIAKDAIVTGRKMPEEPRQYWLAARFTDSRLMAGAQRKVRCPQCGLESVWNPDNKWRPFCSERCKTIDLGAWASEAYRVPVQEEVDNLSGETPTA